MWQNLIDRFKKFSRDERDFWCGGLGAMCWYDNFLKLLLGIYLKIFSCQLTASLAKPLAFRRPAGHNLIIEWDLFYPLPTTWHQPEVTLRPPTTAKAPMTTTMKEIEAVESWTKPNEVWEPHGGWTNDVIDKINEDNQKSSRRVDNVSSRVWFEKYSKSPI